MMNHDEQQSALIILALVTMFTSCVCIVGMLDHKERQSALMKMALLTMFTSCVCIVAMVLAVLLVGM